MAVIIAILGFTTLIVVHELGHFLAAKATGMRVRKFSIGFGPPILKIEGKETVFQIAAIPFGGYVQIDGMGGGGEGDEMQAVGARGASAPDFHARPVWQRALVAIAGPAFNFVFAAALFAGLFGTFSAVIRSFEQRTTLVVEDVEADGAAAEAGLKAGDVVLAVDGAAVEGLTDLRRAVGRSKGAALQIQIARGPAGAELPMADHLDPDGGAVRRLPAPPETWPRLTLTMTPHEDARGYKLGAAFAPGRYGAEGPLHAIALGARETWTVTVATFNALRRWVQGADDVQLGSVVRITKMGADTVRRGSAWFLTLMAILSVNLGLLNLLPFPGLDGGRLMFIGIEAVARRPVPRKLEWLIHGVGVLVLLAVIAVVAVKDVSDIFF